MRVLHYSPFKLKVGVEKCRYKNICQLASAAEKSRRNLTG